LLKYLKLPNARRREGLRIHLCHVFVITHEVSSKSQIDSFYKTNKDIILWES